MVLISVRLLLSFALSLPNLIVASPAATTPANTVVVNSAQQYCMILPKGPHTDIGDSESPGGTQSFCSASARTDDSQGLLPDDFWSNVSFKTGTTPHGKKWAQLTGCIRPNTVDRLNSEDSGGQYDSSGGSGGKGNPQGSICTGYQHYVELVEPSSSRACIKCCDDTADCPLNKDTSGCPVVIPGNYFNCD